jgi:hypothetical protein
VQFPSLSDLDDRAMSATLAPLLLLSDSVSSVSISGKLLLSRPWLFSASLRLRGRFAFPMPATLAPPLLLSDSVSSGFIHGKDLL